MFKKLLFSFFSERRLLEIAKKEEYTHAHGSIEQFEEGTRKRNSDFKKEVAKSLRDVLLMLLAAIGLAYIVLRIFLNSQYIGSIFILFGAVIAAFATLGRIGWKIQTMEGDSIVEQINSYLFRLLYRFSVTLVFSGALIRLAI